MTERHLEERVQHDLLTLRRRLRTMADLVLRSLDDAVSAVANQDRKLAYQVVLRDNRIDVLERQIDLLCQEFLVRHMPVAGTLRFILAVGKVNVELERIGDYAESIARRAVAISERREIPERERILEMAKLASQILRQAIQAFLDRNTDLAVATFGLDRDVDEMNKAIFDALAHPTPEEHDFTVRFVLLGLVGRIERVADRACNIAEEAIYAMRGDVVKHLPHKDLRIVFLSEGNSCRGQMAEAIARKLSPDSFVFQSAGTSPAALDPRTIDFLKKKGLDISRERPKSLTTIGRVDDFNVVVTLSSAASEQCPKIPYGSIRLDWDLEDPTKATGSPQQIDAAYERVYNELKTKISELIEGLLGAHAEREEEE